MFQFTSIGYNLTFLPINESAPKNDWDVFFRSTDSLVCCPFGSCIRRVQASYSKRTSSTAYTSQPASNRALTWVVASAMRRVTAFSSRRSSNGSGSSRLSPQNRRSNWYEESAWYSTSNRIFTTSRIAGTSQNSAWTPAWEGGRARTAVSSSFCARVSFAAFWFPACPVSTEHILLSCHSASHSRMVFTLRSTISAMILTSTPREAYRMASAFIRTST